MSTTFSPALMAAVIAAAAALGPATVALLIIYLVQHELLGGLEDARARRVAESLAVAIVPLLIVFAMLVVFRTIDLWR
ncbi:MAG: hypothetical protein U0Z44_15520 [Kouleothrix sp.]